MYLYTELSFISLTCGASWYVLIVYFLWGTSRGINLKPRDSRQALKSICLLYCCPVSVISAAVALQELWKTDLSFMPWSLGTRATLTWAQQAWWLTWNHNSGKLRDQIPLTVQQPLCSWAVLWQAALQERGCADIWWDFWKPAVSVSAEH